MIFLGSCGLSFVAAALALSERYLLATTVGTSGSTSAHVLQWLRILDNNGLVTGAALVLAWWGFERSVSLARVIGLSMVGLVACVALAPTAWHAWTTHFYTPALRAAFGTWRNEIPESAEVLWPHDPVGAWYLLQRSSYWSSYQAVGAVFSKPKALELNRRTTLLLATPGDAKSPEAAPRDKAAVTPLDVVVSDTRGLQRACGNPDIAFVVNWKLVGPTPVEPVAIDPHEANKTMYLYRCADFRRSP